MQVRSSQMDQMGDAQPNRVNVQPCDSTKHWIEFQLVDAENLPIPGEPYKVRLADGSLHTGTLDGEGKVRFDAIVGGQAAISFPGLDAKEWRPL
ncbi:MAG: hypothetical protein SFV54_02100 [Bryobacteraceae bacterium]|nr:hypothetical protein [Bryobacteraceae bacterium]